MLVAHPSPVWGEVRRQFEAPHAELAAVCPLQLRGRLAGSAGTHSCSDKQWAEEASRHILVSS